MANKIKDFRTKELDAFFDRNQDEFLKNMEPIYRNVERHIECCQYIAFDCFGRNYNDDHVFGISSIVLNFFDMLADSEKEEEIIFEQQGSEETSQLD